MAKVNRNPSANQQVSASAQATPQPAVPLVHELRISKDAEDWLKTLSPNLFQTHDDIQRIWSAPVSQFSLTLLRDPEFNSAADEISRAHKGSTLVSYELVLILALWLIRPWRLTKSPNWLRRIWTQAWLGFVFWDLALVAVPYLVWGQAYLTMLKSLSKAFLRHFIT